MSPWEAYDRPGHTVVGDLRVYPQLSSPQLDRTRDVLVWLPPSYAGGERRYPVLYMHDGQNLFDAVTSYVGEWEVDETMMALSGEGVEAIIVGIPNGEEQRVHEYNPYPNSEVPILDGRGEDYLRFVVETVKPLIDQTYRTQPDAAATGMAGSSMGGLISLYGFLRYPTVFGLCGAFSTAYWFGDEGLLRTIPELADGHGRVYLDVGSKEGHIFQDPAPWRPEVWDADRGYLDGVRRIHGALAAKGYRDGENLLYVEDEGAIHHEQDWARRLPAALRWLLG